MAEELPPCGLYKTVLDLPGRADAVPKDRLIYFHNHSDDGRPLVLLPEANANNKWSFMDRGFLVDSTAWTRSLLPMKSEGFYTLGEHFHAGEQIVDKGQVVQLGYNRNAEPIIFFPTFNTETNSLVFPTKGMKLSPDIYKMLQPTSLRGPHVPKDHVH